MFRCCSMRQALILRPRSAAWRVDVGLTDSSLTQLDWTAALVWEPEVRRWRGRYEGFRAVTGAETELEARLGNITR